MCGRYQFGNIGDHAISALVGYDVFEEHGPSMPAARLPLWNIAPTNRAPVVRVAGGRREVVALRWGLVPSWAKDLKIASSLINARGETVASKPAFRSAFKSRRCLVLSTGFYEWTGPKGARQPMLIRPAEGGLVTMAGLFEPWTDKGTGEVTETFTIVTTTPAPAVAPIHDRMPVLLPPETHAAWLDPENRDVDALSGLLRPWAGALDVVPVGAELNAAGFKDRPAGA